MLHHIIAAAAAAPDQGLVSLVTDKLGSVQVLVQSAMVVIGIGFVAFTWITKKAFAPVIGSILMMGVAIFSVYNTDFFANSICKETGKQAKNCAISTDVSKTTAPSGGVTP